MSDLYVYLIRSRNKDNKDVPNFKERIKTILEYKENEDRIIKEFHRFATDGVPGEQTRLYRSVNSRNEEKIREEFIIRLLRDKPSMTTLNRTLASVAQQVDNRDESKWLFDFDEMIKKHIDKFMDDIRKQVNKTMKETFDQSTKNMLSNAVLNILGANETYKQIENNIKCIADARN